jgi:hypothetical protein
LNIYDYYLRVTKLFRKMCNAKANTFEDVKANEPYGMEDTDEAKVQLAAIKKEGLVDMERFFLHQLFIAGLRDELRSKIMEAGKASLQERLSSARELEVILNDQKKSWIIASNP